MADSIVQQFTEFVLSQKDPEYVIEKYHDDEGDHIGFKSDYAFACVSIHEIGKFNIVEYKINNLKNDKTAFYLHFELRDLKHAEDLFDEMIHTFKGLKNQRSVSIILCCTSGITTSYFNEKLVQAAEMLDLNYSFQAVSYDSLYSKGFNADVILLAPQISYQYEKVKEILSDKVVIRIPVNIFAAYDVTKLLYLIRDSLQKNEEEKEQRKLPFERVDFNKLKKILVICIQVENPGISIASRVYNNGDVSSFNHVIKSRYRLRDLEDIMDVAIAKEPDIEQIAVCTPGVCFEGRLTFKTAGIYDVDVMKMFTEKYHRRFVFLNDANAMVLGFYATQKNSENVSFYFHPRASRTSGVGHIVRGQLLSGRNNICGEMQYVHKVIAYSKDPEILAMTPEGSLEIVKKYLVTIIANVDPDIIAIYCDMVPDMDELHHSLAEVFQEEFIPRLVKVNDCVEYMFVGGLMEAARINQK